MIDKLKDFLDSKLTFYRVEIECDLTIIHSVIIASIACHGAAHYFKRNYDKALQFYEDSYKLCISIEQSSKVILNDIDPTFNVRGKYDEALNLSCTSSIAALFNDTDRLNEVMGYHEKYFPTDYDTIGLI
ncbi:unnamed protein product [Adineta steineri]|uniref:Uncharacterized protein n=1 Tax=Adineta steineri TaxID=433720 RepID=A0A813W6T7_9BILA|nr:unnamed protein product [Adineta steineri]CAF3913522.1 unnamed protein product [Adineta steineri]